MLRKKNLHVHLSKKTHEHSTYIWVFFLNFHYTVYFYSYRISKVVLRQIETIQDALKKRNERNLRKNDTSDTVCISHNFYCAIRIELCKNLLFMPQNESRFFLKRCSWSLDCHSEEALFKGVFWNLPWFVPKIETPEVTFNSFAAVPLGCSERPMHF